MTRVAANSRQPLPPAPEAAKTGTPHRMPGSLCSAGAPGDTA